MSISSTSQDMTMERTSSSSGYLSAAEKLDGSADYSTWKFLMELHLIHEDLWDYVHTTPAVTDALGCKRDKKARAKICLMVKPHCLVHVRQAKSAKEAWDALETAFEDKGLNNRCKLLTKLVSLKLEQFTSVREYVTASMNIAQELRDIGKEIDDELLAALLLQGLTEEFQPMRLAIENINAILTTDYVKGKLFQMEDVYAASTSNKPNSAFLTKKKGSFKGKSTYNKEKPKVKCFICEKPHKAKDCPDNPKRKRDAAMQAFALGTSEAGLTNDWIVDSGASTHMSCRQSWFKSLKKTPKPLKIMCADGKEVLGESVGTVECKSIFQGLTISNVTFVPELSSNLLSVNAITKKGLVVVFTENGCDIYKNNECEVKGKSVVKGVEERGIYKIKCCLQGSALATTERDTDMLMLWHRRMGHLGMGNLKLLRNKMAKGVSFPNSLSRLECRPCLAGKQTKQPFQRSGTTRADEMLGLVHSDVCGPMEVPSISGCRYFLTFIDDFTRKTFVYFLKQKSEVFEKFIEFKTLVENQTGKTIKALRTDNGKEFVNKRMDEFLKKYGIQRQLAVEYTPQQNGVAERANRTICEKARCMLAEANLPKRFWAEAVRHAVFLKNRSPTVAVRNMTPEEKWSGRKCDLSQVRIFGCKAFMHVPDQKRTKWDAKSRELIYAGSCNDAKAYRLIEPDTGKLFKARDVVFHENQKYKGQTGDANENSDLIQLLIDKDEAEYIVEDNQDIDVFQDCEEPVTAYEDISQEEPDLRNVEREDVEESTPEGSVEPSSEDTESLVEDTPVESVRRYPLRNRTLKQFPDFVSYKAELNEDPTSVKDALSRSDSMQWKRAIQEELDALYKNGTWVLVKPPAKCNVVDSKWLFRIKEEAGNKRRYKARLVARGFSQRYGVDYDETFSPVVRHSSLRILLAMAARDGWNIDQMDVKTAFLNGELSETVYMKQPEGFEEKGKEDYVCLLKRSLYGLKQAPREWNNKLNAELLNLGFKRSQLEPCIYIRPDIILAVYVDDMLLFWKDPKKFEKLKMDLTSKFEMKDLGQAELMLGIQITQSNDCIKIDQERYIDKVLSNFGMSECKIASTPLVPGQKLEKPGDNHRCDERIPYQNLIGSLMYLSVCTRPDIAHAVHYLSQFNSCYAEEHFIAAKRVLRYLKGTKTLGLKYRKGHGMENLQAYADASHATCYDRRSYSGNVFLWKGGAVSWESRKQQTVALSTAESEYVAMSEATREAIFLKRLIAEITCKPEVPIELCSDSQSAVAIAQNPVHHQRTKHIDVRHHFVREAVERGDVKLKYVETERMVADALTKPLLRGKFDWCIKGMGLN